MSLRSCSHFPFLSREITSLTFQLLFHVTGKAFRNIFFNEVGYVVYVFCVFKFLSWQFTRTFCPGHARVYTCEAWKSVRHAWNCQTDGNNESSMTIIYFSVSTINVRRWITNSSPHSNTLNSVKPRGWYSRCRTNNHEGVNNLRGKLRDL